MEWPAFVVSNPSLMRRVTIKSTTCLADVDQNLIQARIVGGGLQGHKKTANVIHVRRSFGVSSSVVVYQQAEITVTKLTRLRSLFQSDKWAHSACFRKQSSFFSFGLGRSMFCTHLSQTNFALSAASNFSLSFCTSHGPKSPVLLNTRDL